jgi:2-keto-4-pentenoate hydratase/2-oxohepta-3-ene-1,7-dioic acid hydratase in catechol pathway
MITVVAAHCTGSAVKALSYLAGGRATFGLLADGIVHEVEADFRRRHPDLRAVLHAGVLDSLADHVEPQGIPESAVRYLPVIPAPDKTICVGVNYRPHAAEMGRELPDRPLLFARFSGAQVGHREPLVRPALSEQYDFEGELAVVIGRAAWRVDRREAADVIAGYTCFMDGSVRDWQRHTTQYTAGKNFRASGAAGPGLVTRDEIPDASSLLLTTRVNGEVMQRASLSELIFDIPALVAYCSAFTELLPGDLIVTGTPSGVGAGRRPPRWRQAVDRVEVDLGPVGCLCNTVREE